MDNQHARVLNTETVIRLGLQNRVLRKLRELGCKVKAASLDAALTIAVEPDFTTFELKVNAAGSWAKVGSFNVADEVAVKMACLTLAENCRHRVKFKTMDADGGELEMLSYKTNGGLCWRDA